jgi:hypothetical protein
VTEQEPENSAEAQALMEELRRTKVSDLLIHTCSLLASLGYGKLAPEARDLDEARLAIEALKALQSVLSADAARDVQSVVANLQLAFASAVAEPAEKNEGKEPGSSGV